MFFKKKYDVFISYAIEDKFTVAERIVSKLKENGIKVCYLGDELKVGDSISTVISHGLRNSKYLISILSPFYDRNWPFVEFNRFIEKEKLEKKNLIFPVWHDIDYAEAKQKYPMLADRYAMSTQKGLDILSKNLCEAIQYKKRSDFLNRIKQFLITGIFLLVCSVAAFSIYKNYAASPFHLPSKQFVKDVIVKRTNDFQINIQNNLQKTIATTKGKSVPIDSIILAYNNFINISKHERNECRFTGDDFVAYGSNNIKNLGIFVSDLPYNAYDISTPSCYVFEHDSRFIPDTVFNYSFTIINHTPLSIVIDTLFESNGKVHARVTYSQNIRSVTGSFIYPLKASKTRKQLIELTGYEPSEEYIFEMKNGSWKISETK